MSGSSKVSPPWRSDAPAEGRGEPSRNKRAASEAGSAAGSTMGSSWCYADAPSIDSECDYRGTAAHPVPSPNVVEKRRRSLSDGEKAEAGVSREAGSGTFKSPIAQGCRVSRQKLNALQIAGPLTEPEVPTDRSASRERARRGRARRGISSSSDEVVLVPNCASRSFGRYVRVNVSRSNNLLGSVEGPKEHKGKGRRMPFYAGSDGEPERGAEPSSPRAGPGGGTGTSPSTTSVPEDTGGSSSGGRHTSQVPEAFPGEAFG